MPERIRVRQVVEITGLSVRQIQGMAVRGQIPSAAQLGKPARSGQRLKEARMLAG
jgi:predicted DNA-binding transcriptional regulator AlpA